ncbi:hypothetical protein CMEL01_06848 [Colletotrichum melonis]|uniref:Uncharacterized protein n=1 Tax=Colletotrichum melonis TaxID=1209925 RepID=A0AAI9XLE1_9PEZI|nr:hypothetical protein CMEL01_06848 [Colletotrichum melonis]
MGSATSLIIFSPRAFMALFSPSTYQIWMNYLSVGAFFMRRNDFPSLVVFISFFFVANQHVYLTNMSIETCGQRDVR